MGKQHVLNGRPSVLNTMWQLGERPCLPCVQKEAEKEIVLTCTKP